MSDEIVSGSQTETSPEVETERDAETEALFADFNLQPQTQKKDIEFPEITERTDPAIDPEADPELDTPKKTHKFKHNKEEVEVDISTDEKLTDHLQRSLALDKERERKVEYEKGLDRAAKLAGFNSHEELLANLDKMEQRQVKAQEDAFNATKQKVIDDLIYNGVSEEAAREFAENNPLVQQARQAMEEKKTIEQERQAQTKQQHHQSEWAKLYEAFPDIVESSEAFDKGENPDWYTPEMKSMVERGYAPKDAYVLAHGDKIQTQSKKQLEQKLIKQQQLGNRAASQGGTADMPDEPTLLPAQMALAAEFGVDVKGVVRQQKLLNSRR